MKKALPYLAGGVILLILGVFAYAYYRSQAIEEKYNFYSNPAKITAVHYFEEGRAVAITQAEEGNRGGISVGQKYATAVYVGLNKKVFKRVQAGESIGSDEYMYVDIYDLSSSSLKPRRVDLFEAVAAYKPGYLPSTFYRPIFISNGTEYSKVNIVAYDEHASNKYVSEDIYLNLTTGEFQSREEVRGGSDWTPYNTLTVRTDFDEQIKPYGFNSINSDNGLFYDDKENPKNTSINLIQDNPELEEILYEKKGSIYFLLEKSTEEEWINTLFDWFSTPKTPLKVSVNYEPNGPEVSNYTELKAFLDSVRSDNVIDTSSSSTTE